jgi:hypothetical protein
VLFGDRWLGLVVAPRQATHISRRATARDFQRRQVDQTIMRAYDSRQRRAVSREGVGCHAVVHARVAVD